MSIADAATRAGPLDLMSTGLLIPTVQAEPLVISPIRSSPCTLACPAGINVKAYVSLIAEGRHEEALETIRRRCPLPGICGRICHHPCESACRRGRYDEPIAIRSLKRFVADAERDYPKPMPPPQLRSDRPVAVIGSGPAGLTAAYDLRLAGYPVKVFEAESEPGGMLRYGIADYRLPRDVLEAEIDVLCRAGVEILTGRVLGRDVGLEELKAQGYAATLLAVGAQRGRTLGLRGESKTPGVEDALSFLRRVNDGDRTRIEGHVVVIGGGSTAVEAARTALRLGASSVEILYRRYREELLANDEEIEAAEAEGIRFRFLVAPKRLRRKGGRVAAIECIQVGLGEPDTSGRRRPLEIPGSEFTVRTDHVLAAVGQEVDLGFLSGKRASRMSDYGRLVIDEATSMTSLSGIFAAGDAVSGPATVIEAIAAGHRASEAIRHFLEEGRAEIREQRPEKRAPQEHELADPEPLFAERVRPPLVKPEEGEAFAEVERAFTPDEAVKEARRCLRCGPCGECKACAPSCSRRHVMVRVVDESAKSEPTALLRTPGSIAMALPVDRTTPARLLWPVRPGTVVDFDADAGTRVEVLPVRTRVNLDRCRACGRCVDVCAFGALSLDENDPAATIRLESSICRGCNLCSSVCPTHTLTPNALSAEWWTSHLDSALGESLAQEVNGGRDLVLACQRRAGSLERAIENHGATIEVIRFRCVGQLDAGMLLEIYRRPVNRILVAGCLTERCRFNKGSGLAVGQIERAKRMLDQLGLDSTKIVADWSPSRVEDPLAATVARLDEEASGHHARKGRRQ